MSASSYLVSLLAYDRFLHIRHPQNPNLKPSTFITITSILILLAIVVPMIRLFPSDAGKKAYTSLVLINGVLTITTIILSYCGLIYLLHNQPPLPNNCRFRTQVQRERRIMKTVFTLITLYISLLTPMMIYHVLVHCVPLQLSTMSAMYIVAIMSLSLSGIANPIMYFYTNKRIRQSITRTFRRRSHSRAPRHNIRKTPTFSTPHTSRRLGLRDTRL